MILKRKLYSQVEEEQREFARGTKEAGKAAKEFLKKKARNNSEKFRNKLIDAFKNGDQHYGVAIGQQYVEGGSRVVQGRPKVAALAGGGTEVIPGASRRINTPGYHRDITVRPKELVNPIKESSNAQINSIKRDVKTAGRKLKNADFDYSVLPTNGSNVKENIANAYIETSNSARYNRRDNQGIDLLEFRKKLKGRSFRANGKYGEHPYLTRDELLKVAEREKYDPYSSIRKLID
jgi:hypothetical protein